MSSRHAVLSSTSSLPLRARLPPAVLGRRHVGHPPPSSSHHQQHPPTLSRSISDLATARTSEPPSSTPFDWQPGPSSRGPEGLRWDGSLRAFRVREGKERELEPELNRRGSTVSPQQTLSDRPYKGEALDGIHRAPRGRRLKGRSGIRSAPSLAARRRPCRLDQLLPTDAPPVRLPTSSFPLPASPPPSSSDRPPRQVTSRSSSRISKAPPPPALSTAPPTIPTSSLDDLSHPSANPTSPPSTTTSVDSEWISMLSSNLSRFDCLQALNAVLPPISDVRSETREERREKAGAALELDSLSRGEESLEIQYLRCRAELTLDSEITLLEARTRYGKLFSSPDVKHHLPILQALALSPNQDGVYEAAAALAHASPYLDLNISQAQERYGDIFRTTLNRLAAVADLKGFEQMLWALERLTASESVPPSAHPFLASISRHLLRFVPTSADPEFALLVDKRLVSNPILRPTSSSRTRLALSLPSPTYSLRLLSNEKLSPRHATLVLHRLLELLKTMEGDGKDIKEAASLLVDVYWLDKLPPFVQHPTSLRAVRFLACKGQILAALDILNTSIGHHGLKELSYGLACKIFGDLLDLRSPGAFHPTLELFRALPTQKQTLDRFNRFILSTNRTFSTRSDADVATGQIEKLLAERNDLSPDLKTLEARLHAPSRISRDHSVGDDLEGPDGSSRIRQAAFDEMLELCLARGSTFKRSTWNLVLQTVGQVSDTLRSMEVLDWMRMHGKQPDISTYNAFLASSLGARRVFGQGKLKRFNACLRTLVREETDFRPDTDTFVVIIRALIHRHAVHISADTLRTFFDFYAKRTSLPGCPEDGLFVGLPPAPTPPPLHPQPHRKRTAAKHGDDDTGTSQDFQLPRLKFDFSRPLNYERHVVRVYDLFAEGFRQREDFVSLRAVERAKERAELERYARRTPRGGRKFREHNW